MATTYELVQCLARGVEAKLSNGPLPKWFWTRKTSKRLKLESAMLLRKWLMDGAPSHFGSYWSITSLLTNG